jgi:hypothetical protein
MKRVVMRSTLLSAVLVLAIAGCGNSPAPEDTSNDGGPDISGDIIVPDGTAEVITTDTRDVEDLDTLIPVDTDVAADDSVRDIPDDQTTVEVYDITHDIKDASDIGDVGDNPDIQVIECINVEDCAGKLTLEVCHVAACNDDNLCVAVFAENDSSCSDNLFCTIEDKCLDGECIGAPKDCDDDLECTQDLCDEANSCYHRPYYGPCNDGNACTGDDSCSSGSCIGTTLDCNDTNDCTDDRCDTASGCVHDKRSGMKCDDDNPCTITDTCTNGVCIGTNSCDDDNPCTTDGCNELGCTHDPLTGQECNDNLLCTENDSCRSGTCTGDTVVCDDTNVCTDDYCQEGVGCKTRFNSAGCNDGKPCTRNDRCQYGVCGGTTYSCPVLTCMAANNCDGSGGCVPVNADFGTPCPADTNQCTDDICSAGACTHPKSETGTPCNDNNLCTRTDECSNGACVGHNPVACSIVDPCKDPGTCDPSTGTCTLGVLPEGSNCNDGNLCTRFDKCVAQECVGTATVCPPISNCHLAGTCNTADGTCSEVFKPNNSTCNDSNPCTQTDTCQDGSCVGANPVICQPLDGCHIAGSCNLANGQCSNPIAPNDTACSDLNLCTKTDKCTNGSCSGIAYSCNDNLSCTDDSCDGLGGCINAVQEGWCRINNECVMPGSYNPTSGCQYCDPLLDREGWSPVNGGFCDDLDQCSLNDTCVDGECIGEVYSCDDNIACTDDACDGLGNCFNPISPGACLISGVCFVNNQQDPGYACRTCNTQYSQTQFTPRAEGENCQDGIPCTKEDKCVAGVCSGIDYSCSDTLACTNDVCVGDGTCRFDIQPDFCLIDDICVAANTPQPDNACGACLPSTSNQFWSAWREGLSCDDGSLCTVGDKCASGDCIGLAKCDDAIACTIDTCDALGQCTNTVEVNACSIDGLCYEFGQQKGQNQCERCVPPTSNTAWTITDGGECDDQDTCTIGDICIGNSCQGNPIICDDHLACTTDFCQFSLCGTVPLTGWCVIDNQCVLGGVKHATNVCLMCDPAANPYAWSYDDGIVCNDLNSCSFGDFCFAGECAGQAYDCNDGVPCTVDICNGLGGCGYEVEEAKCLILGGCYDGGEANIGNLCEFCNPAASVAEWSANDGVVCDDELDCTSNDACLNHQCEGTSYSCDDELSCTADSCNGDGTCSHVTTSGWCLIDGTCFRDQTLNATNHCLACVSSSSRSDWSFNDSLPCDDGEICTRHDVCTSGECVGRAYTCDDGMACTTDECDGQGGCLFTLKPGFCRIMNKCYAANSPSPDNICQKCTPTLSTEEWSLNDGMFCNDFQSCTINDICLDGLCQGLEYSCEDNIVCTLDQCDSAGGCTNPLSPDACIINDVCYNVGDPKPGIPCEACVPTTNQFGWTELNPGAIEICNGIDDNCDGILDPIGAPGCIVYYRDIDSDGVGVTEDFKCLCKPDVVYKTPIPGDCNDSNPSMYPGFEESCDSIDNDCDGVTDPVNTFGCQVFYLDNDDDAYGVETSSRCLCSPQGLYRTLSVGDCDDANVNRNPGKTEVCNGIDDNCDLIADPPDLTGCVRYYVDTDDDTWGDTLISACLCGPTQEFTATRGDDCNDFDDTINPDNVEVCDGKDNDCSGFADDTPIAQLCPHNPALLAHATMFCRGTCVVECEAADPVLEQPGWYNFDSNLANGCECQGDQFELKGGANENWPYNLGTLPDDSTLATFDGKLSFPTQEDWFIVTGTDIGWTEEPTGCDTYNLTIFLKNNPNSDYEIDVYKRVETESGYYMSLLCGNAQTWDFATNFYSATLGECPSDSSPVQSCSAPKPDLAECKRIHGTDWVNKCNTCPGYASPGAHVSSDNTRTVFVKVRRKAGVTPRCTTYQLEVSNGYYGYVAP